MDAQSQLVNRRRLLKAGTVLVSASAVAAALETLVWKPNRLALAHTQTSLPDIQFDLGKFLPPANLQTLNDGAGDVPFLFGPVFNQFNTMKLTRFPSMKDVHILEKALAQIEAVYPFSPSGVFTIISYGIPYFTRLPKRLVEAHMPRLLKDPSRFALEEAVPGPTDFPNQKKKTFNIPVVIEQNDVQIMLSSDILSNVQDVSRWLRGSNSLKGKHVPSPDFNGLFTFTSERLMFQQIGLTRKIADQFQLPFASRVNPKSSTWMGFLDQQLAASSPGDIIAFQGTDKARFTSLPNDYFKNGAIQHLSHVIQDLEQFYADDEPYTSRLQYMFRADPIPSLGNVNDQFTNGGGAAAVPNDATNFLKFRKQGTTEANEIGKDIGTIGDGKNPINDPEPATTPDPNDVGKRRPMMGHVAALQQSSRAADGTPLHMRTDGPGFDSIDVPNGTTQPKLHFNVFVPTADFFAVMRANQAALKFQATEDADGNPTSLGVLPKHNGLERFITTTRRQNFLVPPRSHRVFPLRELLEEE